MPNNASTKYGSRCQSGKQYTGTSRHSDGTRSHDARRADPALLHDAWYRATAAKRHPDGQRDDGFTAYGRLPLAESIFLQGYSLMPTQRSWVWMKREMQQEVKTFYFQLCELSPESQPRLASSHARAISGRFPIPTTNSQAGCS